jgi:hypothetical protein
MIYRFDFVPSMAAVKSVRLKVVIRLQEDEQRFVHRMVEVFDARWKVVHGLRLGSINSVELMGVNHKGIDKAIVIC